MSTARGLRFGGLVWAKIFLAFGDVPERCIDIVNEAITRGIREESAGSAMSAPAMLGARRAIAASSREQRVLARRCEQLASRAIRARDFAAELEKRVAAKGEEWLQQARRHPNMWHDQEACERWEWQQEMVNDAWGEAEELSEQAGLPYRNRRGELVGWVDEDGGAPGVAIRQYLLELQQARARAWHG